MAGQLERSETVLPNVVVDGSDVDAWLARDAGRMQDMLLRSGALLVRGLPVLASKKLEKVLTALFDGPLLEYNFGSTPRTKIRGRIYTSTEYPATEAIPLHNENSYTRRWPLHIAFHCVQPAESGGETPIADSRRVYDGIPEHIRERFARRRLVYVRNYGDIDVPWQQVFKTDDRLEVEEYCDEHDIEYEWRDEHRLHTRQVVDAVRVHPRTRESVWFNQAHLFHVSALGAEARATLEQLYEQDELPRNVYYADGGDIDVADLDVIRRAYGEYMTKFEWQAGDLLLLDNMLHAHGRLPYTGNRRVIVGMAGEMSSEEVVDWSEGMRAVSALAS
jgi:alpha-ketoglutarate-dependent taurine dioxygenase